VKFESKNVVVTGGANGIGKRIAEQFLAQGANVAVIDKDGDAGEAFASAHAGRVFFSRGDVSEEETVARFVAEVAARFGEVHALVNNAGLGRGGILSGCSAEDFLYVYRTCVLAPYLLTRGLMEFFAKGAAVVNIASTRALMSQPDTESYTAAKGGVVALTHALAASLAGRVRVNCVSPGWITSAELPDVEHQQHPAGRVGKPEDIAAMVLYLCGEEAGFITGQNFVVDGGMTKLMIYNGDNGWKLETEN